MAGLGGAVVASSQCFGTSGRLALAPVADWLRHPAVLAASAALDPAWRAEVGRLLPAEGREERGAGPRAMVDSWQRHRFFEGLARALMAVGRPTLLVLDNLQWCDQETLSFITFFLGLAADTPVLVVGTLARRRLRRRSGAGGLDGADAGHRTADRAVPQPAGRRRNRAAGRGDLRPAAARPRRRPACRPTTGGFPLYIVEAMRGRDDRRPHPAAGRRSRGRAAQPARAGVRARPRGGRPGGGGGGRTSPSTCSPRRVTWTRAPSWEPSTSCGGTGSCASTATATTSPTTCSARRPTRWSARRSGGCCTGGWRRRSSCCIPATRTRSRLSSPGSTPAAGS